MQQIKKNQQTLKQSCVNKHEGFTLIELLIVLAIIAICGSWAIPGYQSFVLKNQRTEAKVVLLTLQSELERYYFERHEYPKELSELKQYQTDQLETDSQSYLISLESSEDCPTENCYQLVAKHQSGEDAETLNLFATGEKRGPW